MSTQTSIYIGFSRPTEWKIGAKAISWWMRQPYSHVYIRFVSSDSDIPSNVYHAANGMVHFRAFENFKKDNLVIKEYEIPLTAEARKRTLIKCMKLSAEHYGWLELPKIFVSDVAYSCFGRDIHFENSKGYICSELVGTLLTEELGIQFCHPTHLLKPSHIDNKLKSLNYKVI